MKNDFFYLFALVFVFAINMGCSSVNIQEAKYKVVEKDGNFEIRDYAPQILAETIIDGSFENAGNKAFRRLYRYISGNNQLKLKVDMTTPVSQKATSKAIKMTAPVSQQQVEDKWIVSFMMPASYTMETIPHPNDPKVKLRKIPSRRMAAVCYSGVWSKENYLKNKARLDAWMQRKDLVGTGNPVWARYNPPYTLWFLRRNEILIELKTKN